ncbi:hypothetical protein D1007_55663 [Hordeum vulgare]|nr:hypothetical protein D1007_55663 [Hordeum vulgare]
MFSGEAMMTPLPNPSSTSSFTIDLIGMVRNKCLSMDHCTFDLYDGTGFVNVHYWTVKNFNDITHHFLYCIKAHIDISSQSMLQKKLDAVTSASIVMPISHITPSQIPNECSIKEKIFSILRDPAYRDIEHGVSLKLLRSAVGASQDDIMKVIGEQLRLGEMYTTIDERHFKSSN